MTSNPRSEELGRRGVVIGTPPLKYPDALWTENGVAAAKEGETLTRTHTEKPPFLSS